MDKYLKQLESWVMDEGKIVTIEYMLQSTPLNAVQIQSLFKKLLEIHVELNATYYLIGQIGDTTNQRKKCLIMKKEDLERTKQQFDKVTLCNINSVHMAPVKCLEILYNADWNGKREMTMNDLEGKAFIMSTTAEKCYEEMKKFSGENKPPKNETRSPAKHQNQGISPKKSEPPPKIHKGEKPAGAAPKKAVKPKPGTQMKISNFFTQK